MKLSTIVAKVRSTLAQIITRNPRKICTHCENSFTPTVTPDGAVYTDAHGAECCDGCYCVVCGHGHPTADGHEDCLTAFEDGEVEAVDPDAAYDRARDHLIGL